MFNNIVANRDELDSLELRRRMPRTIWTHPKTMKPRYYVNNWRALIGLQVYRDADNRIIRVALRYAEDDMNGGICMRELDICPCEYAMHAKDTVVYYDYNFKLHVHNCNIPIIREAIYAYVALNYA